LRFLNPILELLRRRLHFPQMRIAAHHSPEALNASPKGSAADGAFSKVVASPSGSFSVTNSRTADTRENSQKIEYFQ
jgi:hypothetical protein